MIRSRFQAQPKTIQRDLQNVMTKMEATSLKISQDVFEGTAEIVFDRNGQRYSFRCSKYEDALDNLRAAQLTISYLWRALEEYGVASDIETIDKTFAQFFLGFAATPDDTALLLGSGQEEWWEILGVRPDASRLAITNAFRALAKVHHPDVGGDPTDFKRLRVAYEQALEAIQ
jgi:DnaJ-domain-containing protein 1